MAAAVIGLLLFLILAGLPVPYAMGLATAAGFLVTGEWSLVSVMAQRMYSASTSFVLLAVPFYIFTGLLMNVGGMTDRIFRFASNLVGHLPGGLGHVNVLGSMVFAGMSGSAVADASGIGAVEMRAMQRAGFGLPFSAAITAASSCIGPVIPPSIPFVVFGALTGVSVGALFLGGILPGVAMGLALMVAVYVVAKRRNYPVGPRPASLGEVLRSAVHGIIALGSIVIILGGTVSGLFTATEAGVIAALYAVFVTGVVYRELRWTVFAQTLWETVRSSTQVLFIIGTAGALGWLLTYMRVPESLAASLGSLADSPAAVLLLVNLLLLVLACFMEAISIMLLAVPVLMPVVTSMGVDPVHFGVVVTLNLMIGHITPPVGMALYAVKSVAPELELHELLKELWPFLVSLLAVLLLITLVPDVVLWIPRALLRS